jgi:hypothetical protein
MRSRLTRRPAPYASNVILPSSLTTKTCLSGTLARSHFFDCRLQLKSVLAYRPVNPYIPPAPTTDYQNLAPTSYLH